MAVTNKGTSWEVKKSLWIILSFILFLNGIGIFYAGLKVKAKKWITYGIVYTAIGWITFPLVGSIGNNIRYVFIADMALGTYLISFFVSIIHSFLIRKEYLIRAEIIEDKRVEKIEIGTLRSNIMDEYGLREEIKVKSGSFKSEDNN
ncbi:MAG: hypothetical protein Q8936_08260 [Bacillota bacterium]|nr:hypothetical protein [Bacillota bacterium]